MSREHVALVDVIDGLVASNKLTAEAAQGAKLALQKKAVLAATMIRITRHRCLDQGGNFQ